VVTIVLLTLLEALRRRALFLSVLVIALLLLPAFVPVVGRLLLLPREEANRIVSSLYVFLITDIVKFFASVLALSLAAGTISAELDRGVLSAILPKPVSRLAVYAGKWLGIFLFCAANVVVWEAVVFGVATYRDPAGSHRNIWAALPYVLLYPAIFTTLGMLFSTFASFPLALGLSALAAGVGWSEGMFMVLNNTFRIALLDTFSRGAGYLMPLGRMSRWVSQALGPLETVRGQIEPSRAFQDIPTTPLDLVYVLAWGAVAFVAGAVVFQRRDV